MQKLGLSPVIDDQTEILILGSLPSDKSLAKGEYYANPANDFWKLIGTALNENMEDLSYEGKIQILKAHRIGLWDVYHRCVRRGSLDKNITEREFNDFEMLKTDAPNLRLICLNGQEAKAGESVLNADYRTQVLPSSSGMNRKRHSQRLERWKDALR